jgi:hypothetical protein
MSTGKPPGLFLWHGSWEQLEWKECILFGMELSEFQKSRAVLVHLKIISPQFRRFPE